MKIHEYQGKAILKKYGVAVPRGVMATTREEAEAAAGDKGAGIVIALQQQEAGGLRHGDGVHVSVSCERSASAADIIKKVLWTQLIVILSRTVTALILLDLGATAHAGARETGGTPGAPFANPGRDLLFETFTPLLSSWWHERGRSRLL